MLPANPYDLHEVSLNNATTHARPIEWNSFMVDQQTNKSALGDQVRAIKAVLTCPDCASFVEIIDMYDLNGFYYCSCYKGQRKTRDSIETDNIMYEDPFQDPFSEELNLASFLYPQIASTTVATGTIKKEKRVAPKKPCKVDIKAKSNNVNTPEDDILKLASEPFNDEELLD
jgi:hypothetical protein